MFLIVPKALDIGLLSLGTEQKTLRNGMNLKGYTFIHLWRETGRRGANLFLFQRKPPFPCVREHCVYVTVPQKALDIPHWCVICLLCNEPASFITLN